MLSYIDIDRAEKQWQGWHNTGRRGLIFIMVLYKGNAHRDDSTKHGVGRSGYILQLPGKGYSEIWNRSGKEKSLIIKIDTVVFLLDFFEKQLFDIMFKCINI